VLLGAIDVIVVVVVVVVVVVFPSQVGVAPACPSLDSKF
jgi:hypothetical protein